MKKTIYLIMLVLLLSGCNHITMVSKDLSYMNTYIGIKIYNKDTKIMKEALTNIDKMYAEYDKLADRYKSYDGIININYINNKLGINERLKIDDKLYKLLDYSKRYNDQTNNLFNIALGNVIDTWVQYRDGIKTGVPSITELKNSGSIDINALVLLEDNTIMKTADISLDLGAITKGYVTELAADYLDSIGLHQYLITAGSSSVKVGNHYNNDRYKIRLTDPRPTNKYNKIVKGNNIAITTSGDYERYYEYDGVRYHHVINPNTLFPPNHMLAVTVINDDAALGEVLSTTLFLMPIEDGLEYIKQYDGVEAVWYGTDGTITLSKGMSKYE